MAAPEKLVEASQNGHHPPRQDHVPAPILPLRPWKQIARPDGRRLIVSIATNRLIPPHELSQLYDSSATNVQGNGRKPPEANGTQKEANTPVLTPRLFNDIGFERDSGILALTEDQQLQEFTFSADPKKVILAFTVSHLGQRVTPSKFKASLIEAGFQSAADNLSWYIRGINESVGGEIPFIQKLGHKAVTTYLLPDLKRDQASESENPPREDHAEGELAQSPEDQADPREKILGYTLIEKVQQQEDTTYTLTLANGEVVRGLTNLPEGFLTTFAELQRTTPDGLISDREWREALHRQGVDLDKSTLFTGRRVFSIMAMSQGYRLQNARPSIPGIEGRRYLAKISELPERHTPETLTHSTTKPEQAAGGQASISDRVQAPNRSSSATERTTIKIPEIQPGDITEETKQVLKRLPPGFTGFTDFSREPDGTYTAAFTNNKVIPGITGSLSYLFEGYFEVLKGANFAPSAQDIREAQVKLGQRFIAPFDAQIFSGLQKIGDLYLSRENMSLWFYDDLATATRRCYIRDFSAQSAEAALALAAFIQQKIAATPEASAFFPENPFAVSFKSKEHQPTNGSHGAVVQAQSEAPNPSDSEEQEHATNNPQISARQLYELSTMLLRAQGRMVITSNGRPEKLKLPESLLNACEQVRNSTQFAELLAQPLSPEDTPREREKALLKVMRATNRPGYQLDLRSEATDLDKPFALIQQALATEPTLRNRALWESMGKYFGLSHQETPIFPEPPVTIDSEKLRECIFQAVAHEFGTHPTNTSMARIHGDINERIRRGLPTEQQHAFTPLTFTPEQIVEAFTKVYGKIEQQGIDNTRRAARKETEEWTSEDYKQSWDKLERYKQKAKVAGKQLLPSITSQIKAK